jgi:hypothetical protein
MLYLLSLITMLQQPDSANLREVFRSSVVQAVRTAAQGTSRVQNARTVYVDVGSFREAMGFAGAIPNDWNELQSVVGARGQARRKEDAWGCDPKVDRRPCHALDEGVLLIHADTVVIGDQSLRVRLDLEWGYPRAGRQTGGGMVYDVLFRKVNGSYVFDSIRLVMVS